MKTLTRSVAVLLIVLSFTQPTVAQSRYENGCPCDTAAKLGGYVKSSSGEVKRIADSLFSTDGGRDWAVARINVQKIVGLISQGRTDPSQPLDAYFMALATDGRSGLQVTSWAHQYGLKTWPLVDYGQFPEVRDEGYSRYETAKRAIASKKFLLVAQSGGDVPPADIVLTNTIYFDHTNTPRRYNHFAEINNRFLRSFPAASRGDIYHGGVLFITSSSEGGEEVITIFEVPFTSRMPWRMENESYLFGRAYTISRDSTEAEEALKKKLEALRLMRGRVYLYGDPVRSLDIEGLAQSFGVDLVRRGPAIVKNFAETEKRLKALEQTRFKKKTTVLLNGIPKSTGELARLDPQLNGLAGWHEAYTSVERVMQGKYQERIETKQQLFRELQEGNSDVIFIVAHSDGENLYFGNEIVSAAELDALPDRQNAAMRARLAVLISCSTGKLHAGGSPWSFTAPRALGEILVNKGFFDVVIAPDHDISVGEGIEALDDILQGRGSYALRSTYKGWLKLARTKIYVRNRIG
jgi:hypothetical protein